MTESEYRTFIAARYIAGVVLRYLKRTKMSPDDWRHLPVTPERQQLQHGLCIYLEECKTQYYDTAYHIWTPWGSWRFGVACSGLAALPLKMEGLILEESLGPPVPGRLYGIHKVSNYVFSLPTLRPDNKRLESEAALQKWSKMSARYFERNPKD